MATEHTVGFEPADRLAKDRESVRRRFWIKLKRVVAQMPFAEDLLAAYYCAFDKQTPRHVQAALLGRHRLFHPAVRFHSGHAAGARLHRRCRGARHRDPAGRGPHHAGASRCRPRRAEARDRARRIERAGRVDAAARDEPSGHPLADDRCAQADRPQRIPRGICASAARRGGRCRAHHHRRSDPASADFLLQRSLAARQGHHRAPVSRRARHAATMSNSPIRIAYEGGGPVRCDLTAPPREGEFAILADLRREGFTDYIVYRGAVRRRQLQGAFARHHARRRFRRRRTRAVRGDDPGGRVQSRSAGAAPHRAHIAGYLCRAAIRRPRARGPDPARHRRNHPRGDLAVRSARLHQSVRSAAARGADRSAQLLFRPDVRRGAPSRAARS